MHTRPAVGSTPNFCARRLNAVAQSTLNKESIMSEKQIPLDQTAAQASKVATPLYLREFPEFGPMDVTIPAGFMDSSWHNDVCPSFSKDLFNGQVLRLWVERECADDREYPDLPRFSVALHDFDAAFLDTLATSDDFAEIEQAIAAFKPAVTPFQFLRDVSRMSRDQINDLHEEKVGYRPDNDHFAEIDDLVREVAEIAFYHADGNEANWPMPHTEEELLRFIRGEDSRSGMADRKFSVRSSALPVPVQMSDILPFNVFLRISALSASDRFDIERLTVGDQLLIENEEGTYAVTRSH